MSRLLFVGSYAPYRDGIAAYAVQEVRWLRAQGHDVEALSPVPSAAHHHLPLGGPRSALELARTARGYDRVVVQYHPELFFSRCRGPRDRIATWLALVALTRVAKVELRLHEIDFGAFTGNPIERSLAGRVLRQADELSVHTAQEQRDLTEEFQLPPGHVRLVEHGRAFRPHTALDRAGARAELGLPADAHLFLSIGFLQAHKGFDRAVVAFGRAGLGGAEYHIVGSTRVERPEYVAYAAELARLAEATPGVVLHHHYVSDAEFDRWITAADTVVLPYREIWSSSVIERCRLLGTPAIVTRVGGLADQAPEGTRVVDDDDELVVALQEAAPGAAGPRAERVAPAPAEEGWGVELGALDRDAVQERVRTRAARLAAEDGARAPVGERSAALRALGTVALPPPTSARPGVAPVKRLVGRLVGWQTGSLAEQVAAHQHAVTETIAALEAEIEALKGGGCPAAPDPGAES